MSIQSTFAGIKNDLYNAVEGEIEDRLEDMADYAVRISPVDTGAYVNSFSIKRAGQGGGRMKTSEGKPQNQSPEAVREDSYSNLLGDIQILNISDMVEKGDTRFTLRNRAPHAVDVENGGPNWRTSGYHVFSRIRNKFG